MSFFVVERHAPPGSIPRPSISGDAASTSVSRSVSVHAAPPPASASPAPAPVVLVTASPAVASVGPASSPVGVLTPVLTPVHSLPHVGGGGVGGPAAGPGTPSGGSSVTGTLVSPVVDIVGQFKILDAKFDQLSLTYGRRLNVLMDGFDKDVSGLDAKILSEQTARTTAVDALKAEVDGIQGSLETEKNAMTAAVGALETKVDGIPALLETERNARTTAVGALKAEFDKIPALLETEKNAMTAAVGALVEAERNARTAAVGALKAEFDKIPALLGTETEARTAAVGALKAEVDGLVEAERNARITAVGALETEVDKIPALLEAERNDRVTAVSDIKAEVLREIKDILLPFHAMLREYESHRVATSSVGYFTSMEARMTAAEGLIGALRTDAMSRVDDVKNDVSQKLREMASKYDSGHVRMENRVAALERVLVSPHVAAAVGGGGVATSHYEVCLNRLDTLDTTVRSLPTSVAVEDLRSTLDGYALKCDEARALIDKHVESLRHITSTQTESADNLKSLADKMAELNTQVKTTDTSISGLSSTVNGYKGTVDALTALNLGKGVADLQSVIGKHTEALNDIGSKQTKSCEKLQTLDTSLTRLSDSTNSISAKIQIMGERLDKLDEKIETKVSRYPVQVAGSAVSLTPHNPLPVPVHNVQGGSSTTTDQTSPQGIFSGVVPGMGSTDSNDVDEGRSIVECDSSFDAVSGKVNGSSSGSSYHGDEIFSDESDTDAEELKRKKLGVLKNLMGKDRLRKALKHLSLIVLERTSKLSDFNDEFLDDVYADVVFPVNLERIPFPTKISPSDVLNASWFQGSDTKNLDSIISAFKATYQSADQVFMEKKIWPIVVSQLLTYDADFEWVREVREADLGLSV